MVGLLALLATASCQHTDCDCATGSLEIAVVDKTTNQPITNVTITDSGAGLAVGPQYCPQPDGGAFGPDGGLLLCSDWRFPLCSPSEPNNAAGCVGPGTTSISITAPGYATVSFNVTSSTMASSCACQTLAGSNTADVRLGAGSIDVLETVSLTHN